MYPFRLICAVALSFVGAIGCSRAEAEEYAVDNYHNSYRNERVEDWTRNCKVIAQLPPAGAALPARVTLGFQFDKDVGRVVPYSYRTTFDLATSQDGNAYRYAELRVGRSINPATPYRSTVGFQPITITAAANHTAQIQFEIYADCEQCVLGQEAKPPTSDVTSWRIFGTIRCTADAAGRVAQCVIEDVGSEQPPKDLPSTDPRKFPLRKIPRPPAPPGPTEFSAVGQPYGRSTCCVVPQSKDCAGYSTSSCRDWCRRRRDSSCCRQACGRRR